SSRPQKNRYVQVKPLAGSPLRPKKYGCHGQLVARHGVSLTSAWSDTGLVVSGVPDVTSRSTLSDRINSEATSAARLPLDWLSLETMSTLWVWPPLCRPWARISFT